MLPSKLVGGHQLSKGCPKSFQFKLFIVGERVICQCLCVNDCLSCLSVIILQKPKFLKGSQDAHPCQAQMWLLDACSAARNITALQVRSEARSKLRISLLQPKVFGPVPGTLLDRGLMVAHSFCAWRSKMGLGQEFLDPVVPWRPGKSTSWRWVAPFLCVPGRDGTRRFRRVYLAFRSLASQALTAFFHQPQADAFQRDLGTVGDNYTGADARGLHAVV